MEKPIQISLIELRKTVFKILNSVDGLETISTKQLREECEEKLMLPAGSLNTTENRDLLMNNVHEFRTVFVNGTKNNSDTVDDTKKFKEKKFSQAESDLLMKISKEYIDSNNLEWPALCSGLRNVEDNSRNRKVSLLWKELCCLLPHRKHESIRNHVQRRVMKERGSGGSGWTDENKAYLRELVETKGKDWSTIGRLLGKSKDDCNATYSRLMDRKVHGKFSSNEDKLLIEAIKSVLCLPIDTVVTAIPDRRISWTAVAKILNDQRFPHDYARRWPFARRKQIESDIMSDSSKNLSSDQSLEETNNTTTTNKKASKASKLLFDMPASSHMTKEVISKTLNWLEHIQKV